MISPQVTDFPARVASVALKIWLTIISKVFRIKRQAADYAKNALNLFG